MSEPFIYLSTYVVRPGQFDEAQEAAREVARLVEAREPKMLVFQIFADEAGQQITTVQVHADAENMANHMSVISDHLARSGSWLESVTHAVALGRPPAVMTQWFQEAGEELSQYRRQLAGFTRAAVPVG